MYQSQKIEWYLPENNKSSEWEFRALVTLINLTYYYCCKYTAKALYPASLFLRLTYVHTFRIYRITGLRPTFACR